MNCVFIYYLMITLFATSTSKSGRIPIEGRYSFSFTTFDPTGRLKQLEYAIVASKRGPPLIAIILPKEPGVFLISLQSFPSPLINDDGTTRFVRISKNIVMGHSGIAADGRKLCAIAQSISVTHAYTFDEEIPIDILLGELSLLYQEQTMNAGYRPWGCALLLANIKKQYGRYACRIFTMDPSGSAWEWDNIGTIGRKVGDTLIKRITEKINNFTTNDDAKKLLRSFVEREWKKNKWGKYRDRKETEYCIEGLLTPEKFVINRRRFLMY